MKLFFLTLSLTLCAQAGSVVNGGLLLNQSNANQLATWLGQGDLQFTNVLSQTPATNSSAAFHSAVDGLGPTFTLIQTDKGLVGGYDPLAWSSSNNYNYIPANADRTAFLFNLSTGTVLTQLLDAQGGNYGLYQTYNASYYGPAFGGGFDLALGNDLGGGYAYSYSYGEGVGQSNIFGSSPYTTFVVTRVETFTFSPASATPEPSTILLTGSALAALAFLPKRLKD